MFFQTQLLVRARQQVLRQHLVRLEAQHLAVLLRQPVSGRSLGVINQRLRESLVPIRTVRGVLAAEQSLRGVAGDR